MQAQVLRFQAARLKKPVRISEQIWSEGTIPLVSVFCITYNHVNFIRDAIEGFLMQETTFPVEIFIHDDASTDGTAKIVCDYAEKYPNLFWTILQKENQWSKGRSVLVEYIGLQKGQFIALCEGDDYWSCADKLQKQVEVLEKNKDFSGIFHRGRAVDANKSLLPFVWDNLNYRTSYSQEECLKELKSGYPTCALVFRSSSFPAKIPSYFKESPFDFCLDLVITQFGKLGFIDFEASAYRQHAGGIWSHLSKEKMQLEMVRRYISLFCDKEFRFLFPEIEIILLRQMEVAWWMIFKNTIKSWMYATFIVFSTSRRLGFKFLTKWAFKKNSPIRYKARDLLFKK